MWSVLCRSNMRGAIRVASRPMQSGAMSSSTANFADETARKPKASPHPSNPSSVVTLMISESAAGNPLSPHAAASAVLPRLTGIRSGKASTLAIIISDSGESLRAAMQVVNHHYATAAATRHVDHGIDDILVQSMLAADCQIWPPSIPMDDQS